MPHIQETDTIFGHGGQGPENTHTQTHFIIINHIRVFTGFIFEYLCVCVCGYRGDRAADRCVHRWV